MRQGCAPLAGLAALLAAAMPAAAQMYPGQDVTVNPAAAGNQVLLYPGGQYGRVVHPLLEPGQQTGPIHLHMPKEHHAVRERPVRNEAAIAPAAAAPIAPAPIAPAPVTPPVREVHHEIQKPRHREPVKTASVPPAPPSRDTVSPQGTGSTLSDFEDLETLGGSNKPAAAPPPPARVAKVEPPPVHTEMTRTERKPETGTGDFGSKRSTVLFTAGASDPSGATIDAVKQLAGALGDSSAHIQLYAYGGERGDKTSDARRLSLKRAIVVRQLLIDDGVPSDRIDVHAMGGVDDNGPTDRVDIFLKG